MVKVVASYAIDPGSIPGRATASPLVHIAGRAVLAVSPGSGFPGPEGSKESSGEYCLFFQL